MLCAFCVCSIAVLAGVGGGGILVPMFCALMGLPMSAAVGLSQSTICGQSLLNVCLAVWKRYPDPACSRPLINYQYLTLLVPLGVIGTLVGGVLAKLCPDLVRLVLLFLLLVLVLYRTVKKMIAQYRKDHNTAEGSGSTSVPAEERGQFEVGTETVSPEFTQPQFPPLEIICVLTSFIVNVGFNTWRSKTICGGAVYIACLCVPVVVNIALFLWSRLRLSRMDQHLVTFTWNYSITILYPLVALIAGGAAAMLGIGGGLVLNFVLYEAGFIPEEASLTGGVVTFFLAFSSALDLLMGGQLLIDYGLVLFACGMASTALGQFCFMRLIKKYNLRYLIIASLATIIGGSLIALSSYSIYQSVIVVRADGSIMAPGRVCPLKTNT
ncbi:hypothetical protein DQ04_00321270 [Trypanosoma grayi]|uniref:hypothetical protein n=1 Tax=Trypanosoma grayi TaxID=71804 RepID=UPI0004F48790|nr:hypothetical protein DQ04_00321270 [Trypanosoma grayi]KEG14758.1 hypothetical protein DQ04_00321270 [Trypanosoma grayi]